MQDDIIKAARDGWGWLGLDPKDVLATNVFGNVLVSDIDGRCWRICPEELSAEVVAENEKAYHRLVLDQAFVEDWEMASLVEAAVNQLGSPSVGRCFCLKIPATLGGQYELENIGTVPIVELISSSGDMARQIRDLPDGAQVRIKLID